MDIAGDNGAGAGEFAAAPFVVKTYQIVSDPANGAMISWGRNNNSFVVLDPFAFSQTLLPAHFKHSNFSSFVRQLNTYGFRKVDADRWEFAHASFLRGQKQLLCRIERKRKKRTEDVEIEGEEDEAVVMELVRLKREQRAIDDRVESLWQRVRETESRRRRMLGFLGMVFEDPQMLGQLKNRAEIEEGEGIGWEKKARLRIDCDPPPPPPACFGVGAGGFCGGGAWGLGADLGVEAGAWGIEPFPVDNGF